MRTPIFVASVTALALVPGCRENEEALTAAEARQALEEAAISAQAASLMSSSVEISTSFTIGQAVENAAAELSDYITSQLPCAEITVEGSTLEIAYGVHGGNCIYKGHSYTGSHSITVSKNEEGEVVVEHVWDELSNGKVSMSGDAIVTWNFADVTRHVVHELTWTRLSDGRQGIGSGDRLQRPLEGGLAEGFQVDGERSWQGEAGTWDLDIDGVQMRWIDPVPQAGTYTLKTPKNKTLSLTFSRVDEDTINVLVKGPKHEFDFNVSKIGIIEG
jgi:hypothetical protein